jgi:hypothetical protein
MTNYIQPPVNIDYDLGDYYAELAAHDDAERERMIDKLVDYDFTHGDSSELLDFILREGHPGYDHMTTTDLREEMRTRGLR